MNLCTSKGRLIIFYTFLAAMGLFITCRKIDYTRDQKKGVDVVSKFFNVPANADPVAKRIANAMRGWDKKTGFVAAIAKEQGFPLWGKTLGFANFSNIARDGNSSDTLVMVPIVPDSTDAWEIVEGQVKAFFGCVVREDSINIKLYKGNQYAAYGKTGRKDTLSAELVALTCMNLEYLAYPAHDTFQINDLDLFDDDQYPDSSRYIILAGPDEHARPNDENLMVVGSTELCFQVTTWYSSAPPLLGFRTYQTETEQTVTENFCWDVPQWLETIDEGHVGILTLTCPPTGGTNGSGNLNVNPNCYQIPGAVCGNTNTTGVPWRPIHLINGHVPYNPINYDTIGITDAIRDYYPCAFAFINDSLPNANFLAQLAGSSVFKDSLYMHLTFDTSTALTIRDTAEAETISNTAFVDGDGFMHFNAKIELNGWFLRNATKEEMVAIIIHEIMHAVIKMRWGQYARWLQYGPPNDIDSNWMKNHYPQYWLVYTQQGVPLNQVDHHQIMGTDYFDLFRNTLNQFWNPGSPQALKDSVIKALCYGGLTKTTAWKLLGSQGIDTCRYKAIQVSAGRSETGNYSIGGCNTYNLHYSDSLKLRASCN